MFFLNLNMKTISLNNLGVFLFNYLKLIFQMLKYLILDHRHTSMNKILAHKNTTSIVLFSVKNLNLKTFGEKILNLG